MSSDTTSEGATPEMGREDRLHDMLCRSHFGEELSAAERTELDDALAASTELRAMRDELQATAALVQGALGSGAALERGLDASQRGALRAAAGAGAAASAAATPAPSARPTQPWWMKYVALPAAAGFAGFAALSWWESREEASRSSEPSSGPVTDLASVDSTESGTRRSGLLHAIGYADGAEAADAGEPIVEDFEVPGSVETSVGQDFDATVRDQLNGLGYGASGGRIGYSVVGQPESAGLETVRLDAVAPPTGSAKLGVLQGVSETNPAQGGAAGASPFRLAQGETFLGTTTQTDGSPFPSNSVYVGIGGAPPGVAAVGLNDFGLGDQKRARRRAQPAAPMPGQASPGSGDLFLGGGVAPTGGAGGYYRGPGDTAPPSAGPAAPASSSGGAVARYTPPAADAAAASGAPSSPAPAAPALRTVRELHRGVGGGGAALGQSVLYDWAGQPIELGLVGLSAAAPGMPHHVTRSSAYRALRCQPVRIPNERPRDMFFRFWGDNPFVVTDTDALSTFAADVDTASFTLAERMLKDSMVPAREQIRTEEFVNYAAADLAAPADGTFGIRAEMCPSPFGNGRQLLRIGLRAKDVAKDERPPLALTFVVDVSGSMEQENRLELVKHAMRLLVGQLEPADTVAIVKFSNDASEVLGATPASRADVIETALFGLSPGGGTNAEAGVRLGYEIAQRAAAPDAQRRVVFLSDGVANIGQTDQTAIAAQVTRGVDANVFLNTIGVGLGNHNDVFLEQLANEGQGVCDYVADAETARRAIVDRFTGGFVTVAQDVKIQVEFDTSRVLRWRQLGYENRAVADADFRNDKVDAGEIGAGHQVTCLYELELSPAASGQKPLATTRVRFKPVSGNTVGDVVERTHVTDPVPVASFRAATRGTRRAVLAAQLAEVLRGSIHTAGDSLETLGLECAALLSEDMDDDTARVAAMVKRCLELGIRPRPALADSDPDAAHRRAYYESLIQSLGGVSKAPGTSDSASKGDVESASAEAAAVRDLLRRSRARKDR
ncbi:MAG: von Willebrand factor type A domain-containing protein [Planctomycetota bacterium]